MKPGRLFTSVLLGAALAGLIAAPASLGFGLKDFALKIVDSEGSPSMQAGSHPFALTGSFDVQTEDNPQLGEIPVGQLRDLTTVAPPGLTASPFATPRCKSVDFVTVVHVESIAAPNCPNSTVVGHVRAGLTLSNGAPVVIDTALYNLEPAPGEAAKLGFRFYEAGPVTFDLGIEDTPPYRGIVTLSNVTQTLRALGGSLTVWGNPSDPVHDEERGSCGLFLEINNFPLSSSGSCPTSNPNKPFITLPRSCQGPLQTTFLARSWTEEVFEGTATTPETEGCAKLGFAPKISSKPTTDQAESPTGLDFGLDVADEGLTSPTGIANSDLKKAVVTLPEGMTINPSQAEGLAACSEADFAREKAESAFGEGCPAASKIGTTEVETPLLEGQILKGSLFVAKPFENPFHSLIALYMTIKDPELGLGFKLAGKVEPDPLTGQIVATFDDLPQQPFSHFRLHFREGGRSPLITPALCGQYETKALFTPWANPSAPLATNASFSIDGGVGGEPCSNGSQPFEPGFAAGTLNNDAGSYSPFLTRITRRDGDQDLTKFSAELPLGLTAKLAGVDRCPDAQIALAKTKTGLAELASPSCPSNSQIGVLQAGAGVGSQLTYVSGKVYLAGPYNGAPLSVVEIVPAVAGPFDVGDVVVRQALQVNPKTAEVRVDGDRSDPIPHILAGIPLRVRDVQVSVNRSGFTLNPTSCEPSQIAAQLWGGGADPFSSLDDSPVTRTAPFQAANCAALAFKPNLSLRLKGGTKRGDFPKLHLVYRPRRGDANLQRLSLRFPRSEFIEQGHFRTICTRVQFAAGAGFGAQCPAGSVYGHARVFTPLLDQPFEGPVYLRSSNHNLPDVVLALHGPPSLALQVEVPARIDSIRGGLRAITEETPDVPVSEAIVDMQGGQKGLFVNSTDLCAGKHRAEVRLSAHNGRLANSHPLVRASGCHSRHRKH
jgi:hypothetical protein